MGILSAIIGLFGGSNNAVSTIEKVGGAIFKAGDALVYTDQEKAESLQKKQDAFLEFAKSAYAENSIRSVTRRWLAFIVVGPTMGLFVIGAAVYPFNAVLAKAYFEMFRELVPYAGGVLAFYFGPHLIRAKNG